MFFRSPQTMWWVLLSLTVVIMVTLRSFGFFVEDVQTLFFPVLVICFWKILSIVNVWIANVRNGGDARMPSSSAGTTARHWDFAKIGFTLVLLAWLVSALNMRGLFASVLMPSGIYLSRLDDDPGGKQARDLYRSYHGRIVHTTAPRMMLLQRDFDSNALGSNWLRGNEGALLVLRGIPSWLSVVVPAHPPAVTQLLGEEGATLPADVEALAKALSFTGEDGVMAASFPEFNVPVVVVTSPLYFALPSDPIELRDSFLAAFATGLVGGEESNLSFDEAAKVVGSWKSHEPRATAYFYEGTVDLLKTNASRINTVPDEVSTVEGERLCAVSALEKASQLVQPKYAPELTAALLNNWALAVLLSEEGGRNRQHARQLFSRASRIVRDGVPVIGARAALVNAMLLESRGEL